MSEDIISRDGSHGHLRKYRTDNNEDYTVLEYDADSGSLVHSEGELLGLYGVEPPASFSAMCAGMASWPISPECLAPAVSYFGSALAGVHDEDRKLNEFEMLLKKGGRECWVNVTVLPLVYDDHRITGIIFNSVDEKKRRMLELIGQAETDSLTGAFNRCALEQAVDQMASGGETHAFIMLDIDGFKRLNDTYGHIMGDNMLVDIVKKLRQGLRKEDIIGRVGGDEFMICLRDVADSAAIERLAKHICVLTRHSLPNGMYLSASLGVAVSPRDGTSFGELYRKADIAMYCAKRTGGDGFTLYQPGMSDSAESESDSGTDSDGNGAAVFDYSAFIRLNILNSTYEYPNIVKELFDAKFDSRHIWDIFFEDGVSSAETAARLRKTLTDASLSKSSEASFEQYFLKTRDGIWRWYRVGVIRAAGDSHISITITDINDEIVSNRRLRRIAEYDELTGLLTRSAFNRAVELAMLKRPEDISGGEYAVVFFDILRFKAINDMFGIAEGDRLLIYVADVIAEEMGKEGIACRIGSDRFVAFVRKKGEELERFINRYLDAIARYELASEVVSNAGIYVTGAERLSVDAMIDRAILAQSSIKGSYANKYSYYTEELRDAMISEQEIVGMMTTALAEEQFLVYFQPQYNHSTGKLVGAEALVRWKHPERGMILPGSFIPIFEKNGFISKLDLFVFDQVCAFQRRCLDKGMDIVPISVNLTRHDLLQHGFVDRLEEIRRRHDVDAAYVRIEITETVIAGSNQYAADIIDKLHSCGYVVEMDDFGSGYSSLNVLKDIDMDILKLDMRFLEQNETNNRSGIVLSTIVRMAKWLNLPVIAEGVEKKHQADYLRSIGCYFMQGYLYSKPVSESEYEQLLRNSDISRTHSAAKVIDDFDSMKFWDPESQETLMFNSFVGAAKIFTYHDGNAEVLRVNQKFLKELGGDVTEMDIIHTDPLELYDEESKEIYTQMLQRAIQSGEEEECECWRSISGNVSDRICVRSYVRVIGHSGSNIYVFYESIRNITSEKLTVAEALHRESLFKTASEQANIYYWEYDVKTRIMKPCFRCMRDLGLPPIVCNYPEPAIEMGIFPPEVADMYRQMHKNIEKGIAEQSADIPLTSERVMFRVRYTTEFDEGGAPVKAYGSAVLIQR